MFIVFVIELTIFAEEIILFTLLVIKFAFEVIAFELTAFGTFCSTTSPDAFTIKNLVEVFAIVGLKSLVKFVKRKPELPFVP